MTTPKYHKEKIPAPDKEFNPKDLISREEAISLVTKKLLKDESEWRATRDKVAKRVSYAEKNGGLRFDEGQIVYGVFLAWAKDKKDWSEALNNSKGRVVMGDAHDGLGVGGRAGMLRMPYGRESMRQAMLDLNRQQEAKDREIEQLKREKEEYKRKAERYDDICETNRNNGGKREV